MIIGAAKADIEITLKDAMRNRTIISITDNGLTSAGNQSYQIITDSGKTVGT